MSLPVWEEWIEIPFLLVFRGLCVGLFPYGKSGLKYPGQLADQRFRLSLPVWEEWIEMGR